MMQIASPPPSADPHVPFFSAPQGWAAYTDPASGHGFFCHIATQRVQWGRPDDRKPTPSPSPPPRPSLPPQLTARTRPSQTTLVLGSVSTSAAADFHHGGAPVSTPPSPHAPASDPGAANGVGVSPIKLTYGQAVAAGLSEPQSIITPTSGAPSFPRRWTTTRRRPRDTGRRHPSDGVEIPSTDVRGSNMCPLRFVKSSQHTISLWGAGRVGPDTLVRRVRMHLRDAPVFQIRNLVRVQQESGDVRYDVTFNSALQASSAFPILAKAGPTTGGWLARMWSSFHARHFVKPSTEAETVKLKPTLKALRGPAKRRACSQIQSLVATTLNILSLGSKMERVLRLMEMHSSSVISPQELYGPAQASQVTPQTLRRLPFPGFNTFFGKYDKDIAGSHELMLAFRKPLEVWEYGAPTEFHVAALLDSGFSMILFMSVYVPVTVSVATRRSRKIALAAIFGAIRTFLKKYPEGRICVMGVWNMTPKTLDKHLSLSDLGPKSAPPTGSTTTPRPLRSLDAVDANLPDR